MMTKKNHLLVLVCLLYENYQFFDSVSKANFCLKPIFFLWQKHCLQKHLFLPGDIRYYGLLGFARQVLFFDFMEILEIAQ